MYVVRQPIAVLADLGALLTDNGATRARLVSELARNPNATYAVVRDRLPLYGVDPAAIELVIEEIERARAGK
jgi:hypothetical protein